MRNTQFLRTPINASQQSSLQNVHVSEERLAGNPLSGTYPQALTITFDSTDSDVQIAPLWEGRMRFLADSTSVYPTSRGDVTEGNFGAWSLVGDLVLHTEDWDPRQPFASAFPIVAIAPTLVRYSKVKLTKDFVFTTLRRVQLPIPWREGIHASQLQTSDWQDLVISFFKGEVSFPCPIDASDPTKDFANNPMPAVAQPTSGSSTLTITASSRARELDNLAWFDHEPAYDDLPGVGPIVDPTIVALGDAAYNPLHPGHSVIPLACIYTNATATAFETQHQAGTLLTAIRNVVPAGFRYRRLDILRPPRPGKTASSQPQRPFPQYQLNIQKVGQTNISSLRLPLSGRVYLPLDDGQYKVSATSRQSTAVTTFPEGSQCKVSLQQPGHHYIDLPATSVAVDFTGKDTMQLFAHLFDYDANRAWHVFDSVNRVRTVEPLRRRYGQKWKVRSGDSTDQEMKVNYWYLWPNPGGARTAGMETYKTLYGHIAAAAGRHGLAPEFLQTVVFGEGLDQYVVRSEYAAGHNYNPSLSIDSFSATGLDKIGGVRAADATTGYYQTWIDNGYADPSFGLALSNPRDATNEAGAIKIVDIAGYEAVIEWTAVELQVGLDWMLAKMMALNQDPLSSEPRELEVQRRFIAYLFFNTYTPDANRIPRLRDFRNCQSNQTKRWTGPYPTPMVVRYRSLLRVAVSEVLEELGAYR